MFERFSRPARQIVIDAQEEARSLGHDWVGTEHLLLAALRRPEQPGAATLVRLGVGPESCRAAIDGVIGGTGDGALGPADAEALKALGIDLDEVRRRAEVAFGDGALDSAGAGSVQSVPRRRRVMRRLRRAGRSGPGPDIAEAATGPRGHIRFTARAKKALELSLREAIARKDRSIGTEHVVLALLRGDDKVSQGLFRELGVAPGEMRERVLGDLRPAA